MTLITKFLSGSGKSMLQVMVALPKNEDSLVCGDFFHDDNVAVPIIDRIIHHSHPYKLGGESYRLKQKTLS